jgi:hypothetical protein
MKGLSLTLEIVIIAIVLLVTALVILTVFGGQMANILSALGIVQTSTVQVSQCQTMCSNWCLMNRPATDTEWSTFSYQPPGTTADSDKIQCSNVMKNAGGTTTSKCKCTM